MDSPELVPEKTLTSLFEAQVSRTPDAVALVQGDRTLTYAQLDTAAGKLGRRLLALPIGPEGLVVLALPRSIEAIVALVAVVKAGGAYLPLDPGLPVQRLRRVLDDAAPALVLTTPGHAARFAGPAPVETVDMDGLLRGPPAAAPTNAGGPAALRPQSLAYVIYTSGSTGTPKGVMATHANVASLAWRPLYARLGEGQSVLQFAPLSFDAATFEIWGALLNGARLVLGPPGALDLDALAHTVQANGIDTLWLTAGLFGQVVLTHPRLFAPVRQLLVGGDILPVAAVRAVMALHPDLEVINGYGPTETTTYACTSRITPAEARAEAIPIGSPIQKTRAYVLDETLRPVEDVAEGELYIAGDGVALGYLNQPQLSTERFLCCPFEEGGSSMDRTGDRARWRPDGALDFLGRTDRQVKIRGFRIEPGEVEAALTALAGVGLARVTPRLIGGVTQLVAYLAPRPGAAAPDPDAIRASLAETLPDYMLPAAVVVLDALPLTGNGKLDLDALPDPRQRTGVAARGPETALEAELGRIFSEVLRLDTVDLDRSFFDQGGDSLLGLQLPLAIEESTGRAITMSALWSAPSVRQLARSLEAPTAAPPSRTSLVPLQTDREGPPVFVVHWIERDIVRHLGRSRPVYGLCFGLAGLDRRSSLVHPERLEDLARHYIEEMRSAQAVGPYHLLGHSAGGLIAYEMAQQLTARGETVAMLALLDVNIPSTGGTQPKASLGRQIVNLAKTPLPSLWRRGGEILHGRLLTLAPRRLRLRISASTSVAHRIQLSVLMLRDYDLRPYGGFIHYFKAATPLAGLRSGVEGRPMVDWAALAHGGIQVHEIDANHETIVKDPAAADIVGRLRTAL